MMPRVDFSKSAQVKKNLITKMEKRIIAIGHDMANDIQMSMREGSGREYVRKGVVHRASASGEPPAVDTGRLRASISVNWSDSGSDRATVASPAVSSDGVGQPSREGGEFRVVVGTNVSYALPLETGTPRMSPRPFIRPSFDRIRVKYGL